MSQLPPCPDLRALFGDRYRITWDEAARFERPYPLDRKPSDWIEGVPIDPEGPDEVVRYSHADPWLAQIPGRYGTIYPHGMGKLAVEVNGHKNVAAALRKVPGLTMTQGGDDEFTFAFPVELFDQVAALVHPHR